MGWSKSSIRVVRVSILLTIVSCCGLAGGEEAAPASVDPMIDLNHAFRAAYADARAAALAESGPIIVASGDRLVLLDHGQRTEGEPVDRSYHDLKTVAHVPLAVYLCLAPYGERPLDDTRLDRLRDLREKISAVERTLADRFGEAQRQGQEDLLERCGKFVDNVVEQGTYSKSALHDLLRHVLPQVLVNVEQSVQVRLDNYRRNAAAWRESLGADEWSRLRVVVQGAAMPRDDNLTVQFFAKLLGERGEGTRIIYAESLFDEDKALNLLGTHLLDTQIGIDFFNDRWRMHRDLLGPAAARYLDQE